MVGSYRFVRWSVVLVLLSIAGVAQTPQRGPRPGGEAAPAEEPVPIPPEASSLSKHDVTVGGKTIHYTATAGNLLIRGEKDAANGSIFYAAYTEEGRRRDCVQSRSSITAAREPRRSGSIWGRLARCAW